MWLGVLDCVCGALEDADDGCSEVRSEWSVMVAEVLCCFAEMVCVCLVGVDVLRSMRDVWAGDGYFSWVEVICCHVVILCCS